MGSKDREEWRNQIGYLFRSLGTFTIFAIWAGTAYGQVVPVQSSSIEAHFRLGNLARPRLGVRLSNAVFESTGKNFRFCDGATALVNISTLIATDDTCTTPQRRTFDFSMFSTGRLIFARGANYEEIGVVSSFDVDELTGRFYASIDINENLRPKYGKEQVIIQLGTAGNSLIIGPNGNSELLVVNLESAIWVDPDGCEHWIKDDGAEGFMTPRLDSDGKIVCRGVARHTRRPERDASEPERPN